MFAGLLIAAPIVVFTFYSPILPVADWPIMALVGVAGPAMGLWIADGLFSPAEEAEEEPEERRGLARYVSLPSVAWIMTALMGLCIFWFSFGFFGYMPSFVPSHSMEPNIQQGDVVLTGPVDTAEIETGDVVLYEMGNGQRVLHRVIEIETTDGGERRFILQGDNNNTPDLHPVEPDQVMGQYMGRVPHVGWLPIKFNELVLDKVR
ncbi:MAG: signal peptidase I [Dehalococcoidia bacterium]|nr:signal peptidase I [Dehalococcoidia bacterium]